MMLTYCAECVMPSSKPDLCLDDAGVCNACRSYQERKYIDWKSRKQEFLAISDKYRQKNNWDCLIPVSGGKDSTYQVVRVLQHGLNPLCVTSTTCDLSEIGRHNLDNIKNLGVDLVEFSPNPAVRTKLNYFGLTQLGDISWPEHVGIFTIPVRAAIQFNIPLIIWGENSQNEYGGPAAAANNNVLTRQWLEEFGGLLGFRVSDLVDSGEFSVKQLLPYQYPSDDELKRVGVTGLFLGYYFPWDGLSNAIIAQANGFLTRDCVVEGSIANYENLDNYQTGIHDYFKFLKFGFSRATDIACLHIRRGRITRRDALDMVKKHDGQFPWTCLGKPLKAILSKIGMTVDEFVTVCDKFTNKKIFKRDQAGQLSKDKCGNLQKINDDNVIYETCNH